VNATLLSALTPAERHLVSQTDPQNLNTLTEDEALDLHDLLRRARNKAVGQYRRGGASRVSDRGSRGKAKQTNGNAALKSEAFEEALAKVSRRVATLAKQSAADLKTERLAAAQAARAGQKPTTATRTAPAAKTRAVQKKTGTVAKTKRVADTRAQGARRQAARDSKGR
jgi:hypothetical protein